MQRIVQVTAAILAKYGRIIIAQRKRSDPLAGKWEFPGGKIEPGETPEACLARELKEEFAIDVTIGKFLGSHVHRYEHICVELMAYRAYWVGGVLKMNDHTAFRWVAIDQLKAFDFAPADLPFVQRLEKGRIDLSGS